MIKQGSEEASESSKSISTSESSQEDVIIGSTEMITEDFDYFDRFFIFGLV